MFYIAVSLCQISLYLYQVDLVKTACLYRAATKSLVFESGLFYCSSCHIRRTEFRSSIHQDMYRALRFYYFFIRFILSFNSSAEGIKPFNCSGNSFTNLYSATPKGALLCFKVYSTTMLLASLQRIMPTEGL